MPQVQGQGEPNRNLKACLINRDIGDLQVGIHVIGGISVVQNKLRIDLPTSASQKKRTRGEAEVGCLDWSSFIMHLIYNLETLASHTCQRVALRSEMIH